MTRERVVKRREPLGQPLLQAALHFVCLCLDIFFGKCVKGKNESYNIKVPILFYTSGWWGARFKCKSPMPHRTPPCLALGACPVHSPARSPGPWTSPSQFLPARAELDEVGCERESPPCPEVLRPAWWAGGAKLAWNNRETKRTLENPSSVNPPSL